MEINNFLSITNKDIILKTVTEAAKNSVQNTDNIRTENICKASCDSVILNGKEVSAFGDLSDIDVENLKDVSDASEITTTSNTNTQTITSTEPQVIQDVKNVTEAELQKIKEKIYLIHNTEISFGVNMPFNNVDGLFTFLSDISGGTINKNTGITKSQLTKLTQNDKWEDAHNDFFGSINRAFADKTSDYVISYYDIRHLFYTAAASDAQMNYSEFKNKVENFAQKVQDEFEALSDQEKLEFLLEKTEDYLIAAGLEDQLRALQRLTGENINTDEITLPGNDLIAENTIKLGQIAVTDLEGNQLGGYNSWSNYPSEYEYNGVTYKASLWYGDNDDYTYVEDKNGNYVYDTEIEKYTPYNSSNITHQNLTRYSWQLCDMGLTIDSSYLNADWCLGVDALVHELTHATAFIYYQGMYEKDSEGNLKLQNYPNEQTIEKLHTMGIIDETEAYTLINNPDEYDWNKLKYIMRSAWGEFIAYQADADFIDSIAGDVFDIGKFGMDMTASGADEKDNIRNHIKNYYDNEPVPTNDWWVSYKDTDDWSAYI